MANTKCNSFYAKEDLATDTTKTVVKKPLIVEEKTETKATEPKKKSVLWIWAASAFVALLLSPDENVNSIDKPATP
jgi:hypothetical protein